MQNSLSTLSAGSVCTSIIKGVIAAVFITSAVACAAQTAPETISESDKKIALRLVYEQCPKADVLELERKEDYIEVEYVCEGVLYEVGISSQQILYTETAIGKDQVDIEKIRNKIDKHYPGYLLDEFSKITTPDTSFIRVEIVKNGVEQNIYFTAEGKWYHAETDFSSGNEAAVYEKAYSGLKPPYPFLQPDAVYDMPDVLREISGIAYLAKNKILCVQDELGVVFLYDLQKQGVEKIIRFTDAGDFEDLALRGDTVTVLRSDGTLFEFSLANYTGEHQRYLVPTQSLDLEGLAFEGRHLLLAEKEPAADNHSGARTIYRLLPGQPKSVQPWLSIDQDTIRSRFNRQYPALQSADLQFSPSAVAVHPLSSHVYVLSAKDRLLAIFDQKQLIAIYPLPEKIYFKPEGLAFSPEGILYISSEGDKKGLKGRILQLSPPR